MVTFVNIYSMTVFGGYHVRILLPLCQKKAKEKKAKPLYGTKVCKKCYYGMANRRQIAYIIDIIFWTMILYAIEYIILFFDQYLPFQRSPDPVVYIVLIICYRYVILPMIFAFKDGFNGKSPGKYLCGVEIVDIDTKQPIGFMQAFKRNLVLLIPLVPVFVAFTLAKGSRLGDKWANTKVVLTKYRNHPIFTGNLACEDCQYDLTGNISGVCPECGRSISEQNLEKLNEMVDPCTVAELSV